MLIVMYSHLHSFTNLDCIARYIYFLAVCYWSWAFILPFSFIIISDFFVVTSLSLEVISERFIHGGILCIDSRIIKYVNADVPETCSLLAGGDSTGCSFPVIYGLNDKFQIVSLYTVCSFCSVCFRATV